LQAIANNRGVIKQQFSPVTPGIRIFLDGHDRTVQDRRMSQSIKLAQKFAFLICALFMITPLATGPVALFGGITFAFLFGNPFHEQTKKWTPLFLQASIIGLGAGMDLGVVSRAGLDGVVYTTVGISLTLASGFLLYLILRTERETSFLLSVGTAICGGSAIAAVAPIIRAKDHAVTVALATVFMLNASALLFFPWLGHYFDLSERQFGLFSALAIHDTSSVVGTSLQYGQESLAIATTVKLARALWIIPIAILTGIFWRHGQHARADAKVYRPWFILGFIMSSMLVTWRPELAEAGYSVSSASKHLLILTLFLIGSGLSLKTVRAVGIKPFAQGIILWFLVAGTTLLAIKLGVIH
jgi:uncharacterized integral membrane protein (TIGR00698 family)